MQLLISNHVKMPKEISSPEDLIIYAENKTSDRLATALRGYLLQFDSIKKGERKYTNRRKLFLVDEYNKTLKLFVGGDECLFEKYRYIFMNGYLDGPSLEESK